MANEPDISNDGPLDRAISILVFVAEQKKALSAAEIAAALNLPLPTAHRLIGNLRAIIRYASDGRTVGITAAGLPDGVHRVRK